MKHDTVSEKWMTLGAAIGGAAGTLACAVLALYTL